MSERLCCDGLLSKQDSVHIVSEDMTDRLTMTLDVSDLGWHIQSCTEMKHMQLSSDGKVFKNLDLHCEDLIELELGLWCVVNTSALGEAFMNKVTKVLKSGSCH